jgi:hypothetical protein
MPTYSFHGVRLAVETDCAELTALLAERLASFTLDDGGPSDLVFEVRSVRPGDDPPIARPDEPLRPVYDPPAGEVLYAPREDLLYIDYPGRARVLCDPTAGRTAVSLLAEELAELWLASHPLFTLPLVEMLKRRGLYSVHAAGLALDGKAILLAGPTGAGKSTLTVALAGAGFEVLGDDIVFASESDGGLRLLAFPDELDVTEETIRLFPELDFLLEHPPRPGWSKRQLRAAELPSAGLRLEAEPAAVVVLARRRHADESVLEPVARTEALLELVPNVLLTDRDSSQRHLDALDTLVRASRCYRLEAGGDFDALARLVKDAVVDS